jgi:hypothetical protein
MNPDEYKIGPDGLRGDERDHNPIDWRWIERMKARLIESRAETETEKRAHAKTRAERDRLRAAAKPFALFCEAYDGKQNNLGEAMRRPHRENCDICHTLVCEHTKAALKAALAEPTPIQPATDEEVERQRAGTFGPVFTWVLRLIARIDAEKAAREKAEAALLSFLDDGTPWAPDTPGMAYAREVYARRKKDTP